MSLDRGLHTVARGLICLFITTAQGAQLFIPEIRKALADPLQIRRFVLLQRVISTETFLYGKARRFIR